MTVPSSVHINLRLYSKPRILFEQFVQKQGQTVKRTEVIDTYENKHKTNWKSDNRIKRQKDRQTEKEKERNSAIKHKSEFQIKNCNWKRFAKNLRQIFND